MKLLNTRLLAMAVVLSASLIAVQASAAVIYFADDEGATGAYDDQTGVVSAVGNVSDSFTVSQNIGIAFDALSDRILLLDRNAPMVYAMDPSNGNVVELFAPNETFQGGAVKDGILYGINEGTQNAVAYDLDGNGVALSGITPNELDHSHGMGIDTATGQLYGCDGDEIYELNDDGSRGAFANSYPEISCEDIDPYDGGFLMVTYDRDVLQIDSGGSDSIFLTDEQLSAAGVESNMSGVVVGSPVEPPTPVPSLSAIALWLFAGLMLLTAFGRLRSVRQKS